MKLRANFIKGTTPTINLNISEDFESFENLIVRLKQGETILDVNPTYLNKVITFTLTQEQTLLFEAGEVELQVIALITSPLDQDVVYKSEVDTIDVLPSIYEKEV